MQHSFDIDIATKYGIPEAILLNHIHFWITKNIANDTNHFDGYYWTYNSVRAFSELFPYMGIKRIRNALKKLVDDGILTTGNYNKSAYDRTLWYALTDKGFSICQNGKMDFEKMSNENAPQGEPIPYINTDINKDKDIYTREDIPYTDIVDYLNKVCGTSYRASSRKTKDSIKARWNEGFRLEDFQKVINNKAGEWLNTDMSKYLRPETLFGSKFEGYLNQKTKPRNNITMDSGFRQELGGYQNELDDLIGFNT